MMFAPVCDVMREVNDYRQQPECPVGLQCELGSLETRC